VDEGIGGLKLGVLADLGGVVADPAVALKDRDHRQDAIVATELLYLLGLA
jgi:hypothetical protein